MKISAGALGKNMFRIGSFVLTAIMLLGLLAGCGETTTDRSPSTPSEDAVTSGATNSPANSPSGKTEYDLAALEYMVGNVGYKQTDGQDENWEYSVHYYTNDPKRSYVTLQKYIGSSSEVVIPETIEGYPVTHISALRSSNYASETDIVSISFPDTLYFIASGVFDDSTWYKNQPDGVVYAGKVAYKYKGDMPQNTEIEIPDGIVGIAGNAFEKCSGLVKISLPDSLIVIANSAFASCTSLSEVRMSKNIMRMTARVFYDCNSLKAIYLPKSIRSIVGTFQKCNAVIYYEGSSVEWSQVRDLSNVSVRYDTQFPY